MGVAVPVAPAGVVAVGNAPRGEPLDRLRQVPDDAPGWERFWAVIAFGVIIASTIVMNCYPIRYIHIGRFMSRHPWMARIGLILLLCSVFTPFYGYLFLAGMLFYAISPFITWRMIL